MSFLNILLDFINLVLYLGHTFLETLDTFTKASHELRNLLSTEKKKYDKGISAISPQPKSNTNGQIDNTVFMIFMN